MPMLYASQYVRAVPGRPALYCSNSAPPYKPLTIPLICPEAKYGWSIGAACALEITTKGTGTSPRADVVCSIQARAESALSVIRIKTENCESEVTPSTGGNVHAGMGVKSDKLGFRTKLIGGGCGWIFCKGADAHLSAGQVAQVQILGPALIVVSSQGAGGNKTFSQERTSFVGRNKSQTRLS